MKRFERNLQLFSLSHNVMWCVCLCHLSRVWFGIWIPGDELLRKITLLIHFPIYFLTVAAPTLPRSSDPSGWEKLNALELRGKWEDCDNDNRRKLVTVMDDDCKVIQTVKEALICLSINPKSIHFSIVQYAFRLNALRFNLVLKK